MTSTAEIERLQRALVSARRTATVAQLGLPRHGVTHLQLQDIINGIDSALNPEQGDE